MILTHLQKQYTNDLTKLKEEISAYKNESNIWLTPGGINNSAGNLCMHLSGNLLHFIGAVLGETGYVRDREFEFNGKDVSREDLLKGVDEAIEVVTATLGKLDESDLEKEYPLDVFGHGDGMKTGYFIIHLRAHLAYHLGQVSYHRRVTDA